ncbi:MAG: hypothetical protein ABS939_13730 [Psychrobacillus sp.]
MKEFGYEVIFEHDELFDKIIMKIIANSQIIFYEVVTEDVLRVAREYNEEVSSCGKRGVVRNIRRM